MSIYINDVQIFLHKTNVPTIILLCIISIYQQFFKSFCGGFIDNIFTEIIIYQQFFKSFCGGFIDNFLQK
ncbi:MAG: hypothetical protein Gaeavirus11_9 [Gaeavirus sp.]|uniref:Uncharacterized protein n=1 Tax=Gaeavirus sp. TaxID=2487767 RepID=A0A3G5A3U1_9VIRU|nr:MAG: hypothetical protein Gaeavirus11_9 [Gaeavirus sp.]